MPEGKDVFCITYRKGVFQHCNTSKTRHGAAVCQVCFARTFTCIKAIMFYVVLQKDLG